eukprot:11552563-Alexandrium_andersonii.AAC.1
MSRLHITTQHSTAQRSTAQPNATQSNTTTPHHVMAYGGLPAASYETRVRAISRRRQLKPFGLTRMQRPCPIAGPQTMPQTQPSGPPLAHRFSRGSLMKTDGGAYC